MAVFQLSLPPALAEGGAGTEENRKIRSYLFQLTEQLRYTLNHLDDENFSEGGISPEPIAGLGTEISKAARRRLARRRSARRRSSTWRRRWRRLSPRPWAQR